jgi:hypothetical protein
MLWLVAGGAFLGGLAVGAIIPAFARTVLALRSALRGAP